MNRLLHRLALLFLMAFALLTTLMVTRLALGQVNPPWATPVTTLACFLFAVCHACARLGWRPAVTLVVLSFGISLACESLGVATGWVYGPYVYSSQLGPKFLGLVPYLIPLAWFMMMYPSFLIARWLIPNGPRRWLRGLILAAVAAAIMTSWDLMMDPLMVQGGYWTWLVPGPYFGVPLQNYLGWWLTTFLTFGVFLLFWPGQIETGGSAGPAAGRWDGWAFVSFLVTAVGNGVAALVNGLAGPALVGLFAMGPWLLLGWWKALATGNFS